MIIPSLSVVEPSLSVMRTAAARGRWADRPGSGTAAPGLPRPTPGPASPDELKIPNAARRATVGQLPGRACMAGTWGDFHHASSSSFPVLPLMPLQSPAATCLLPHRACFSFTWNRLLNSPYTRVEDFVKQFYPRCRSRDVMVRPCPARASIGPFGFLGADSVRRPGPRGATIRGAEVVYCFERGTFLVAP